MEIPIHHLWIKVQCTGISDMKFKLGGGVGGGGTLKIPPYLTYEHMSRCDLYGLAAPSRPVYWTGYLGVCRMPLLRQS